MEIKPYTKNAKKHPKKHIEQVANSIKEFGMNQPIVVDKEGVIIVGHGRYEALKQLGWGQEQIEKHVKVADLTDEQAKAYRLADNKLNESEWDMGLAIEELKELSPEMFDLTGFDKDLLIEPDARDDEIPENAPTIAKLGDVWQLGRHRVMCGDSTDKDAVARLMDGKKADMVFTDPPYGVDYTGKTEDALKIENDKHTHSFALAMPNFIESTKMGASFYVCCPPGNNFIDFIRPFSEYCHQSSTIIWVKNSLVMGHGDYHYQHEPILYGWNKNGTHQFYGDRTNTTIWEVDRPSRSKEHPTMKPVELITKAIANSSKEDDIILDLFLGSGSTLIACEKTNRICYGMELDPKYVDVIIKRWEDYTSQDAVKLSTI